MDAVEKLRGSTLTRSTASNLEQVANLLCAPANSASYPQPNGKLVAAKGPFIATQLNSTRRRVELSCVAIDTLTDATQLSPTIGNATDPVEQCTANQREAYNYLQL